MTSEPIRCPRDNAHAHLIREEGGGVPFYIDFCGTCRGAWLDHGEFAKIIGSEAAERVLGDYASGMSGLKCPRDGADMARRPIGGIEIDVCPTCRGLWFDRRELEAAMAGTTEVLAQRVRSPEAVGGRATIPAEGEAAESQRSLLLESLSRATRSQISFNP
jgi:Zn-finger nucleic acid-binding protein